jgi:hypothetical protein
MPLFVSFLLHSLPLLPSSYLAGMSSPQGAFPDVISSGLRTGLVGAPKHPGLLQTRHFLHCVSIFPLTLNSSIVGTGLAISSYTPGLTQSPAALECLLIQQETDQMNPMSSLNRFYSELCPPNLHVACSVHKSHTYFFLIKPPHTVSTKQCLS